MTAETLELAIQVERRPTGVAWQPFEWHATKIGHADAPPRKDGVANEILPLRGVLTLHRSEAENYLFNLSGDAAPSVYVVLTKPADEASRPELLVLTCDPYEAQSFTLANDRMVDALPMTPEIQDWVRRFVAVHYKEEVFVKRQRGHKVPGPDKRGNHGAG